MQQVTHPGTIKRNCRFQRVVRSACFRHRKKLMRLVGQFGVLLPPRERRLEPPHCNPNITVSVPLCSNCHFRIPHRKLTDKLFISLAETMSDSPPVHCLYPWLRQWVTAHLSTVYIPGWDNEWQPTCPLFISLAETMSDSPPAHCLYPWLRQWVTAHLSTVYIPGWDNEWQPTCPPTLPTCNKTRLSVAIQLLTL